MPRQTLKKREDNRYKCKYHGIQFYGKTQKEAFLKRNEYIAAEKAGSVHELEKVSLLDYGMRWLAIYRADCGKHQQNQYAGMIEFAAENVGKRKIRDITATDLQALCNMLTPYSQSYVSKFMTTLRGIFKSAYADGAITRNPMDNVKRPKCQKTEGHRALEQWERDLIMSTYKEHDFGLVAMVMLFAGLRRGEALYIDVDRDVDFELKTITVHGAVSFVDSNQPKITNGKTENAQRTIPLFPPLEEALRGHHGLLCTKMDGTLMSESAFDRKFDSYRSFLATKINGCQKRWYGKTKAHKQMLAEGKELPEWRDVTFRCHDFRVDFCTHAYYARVPEKTLQSWMGHASAQMIMEIYAKLTAEEEKADALRFSEYLSKPIFSSDDQTSVATA